MSNGYVVTKERWIGILRVKASEYEHKARKEGDDVTSPSLDSIAWEIEAFFAGLSGGEEIE